MKEDLSTSKVALYRLRVGILLHQELDTKDLQKKVNNAQLAHVLGPIFGHYSSFCILQFFSVFFCIYTLYFCFSADLILMLVLNTTHKTTQLPLLSFCWCTQTGFLKTFLMTNMRERFKPCKNCECCPVSQLIVKYYLKQRLSRIQVLNCWYCKQCLKCHKSL